jgi:hypothetical protein
MLRPVSYQPGPPPQWPPPASSLPFPGEQPPPRQGVPRWFVGLALLILAVTAVIGLVTSSRVHYRPWSPVPEAPAAQPSTHPLVPTPALSAATATVTGGPGSSFDLPLGTAAQFTDRDGTWTVAVLGIARVDDCTDLLGDTSPALVADIRVEALAGAVSVIPFTDFTYIGADGIRVAGSFVADCADPALSTTILSAGATWGWVSFPAASGGGGTIDYGQLGTPTASWTVAGR